ncbi:MAG TPA: DUF2790 domain-containing protein [Pseudomonas sp.]|jgi:hypothetical protein
MKTTLIALTLVTLGSVATVANAGLKPVAAVQDYTYSTKLDIAKVVATPELNFCGVRPVEMTYIDHKGQVHTLRYEVNGTGCLGDN